MMIEDLCFSSFQRLAQQQQQFSTDLPAQTENIPQPESEIAAAVSENHMNIVTTSVDTTSSTAAVAANIVTLESQ